ncbi:Myosin type-2 heavy chain 1 [Apophysomyces sp. BC1034]|nr:Myosin type-2 heavy chain 1 [Apophysomyces sp. BC1015]KAG0172605.1 Myosin type-2 heavy chain 1 [Apophysomyces sp. BC1021]KAG0185320.1 Myosin type-2 heavy chain 1 [Apophysomyces sp. BC1034]
MSPSASQAIEVYTKGTKAWFADEEEAWVSATCVSRTITNNKARLVFQSENDEKEYVFEASLPDIEKSGGSTLPPLRNPPNMEQTDDLTNLSYLNEPAVLNTIRTRYIQRLIYTYSGIVLIAVNPFDRVALYDPDVVQQYSGRRRGELEPHLFAIAEDAYRCMIREQKNQTIVVSGESGAGKTVSAKYIMRYFATADDQEVVGKKKKEDGGMTEVEEQILATNPIMEAFGNAKTTRNDNSSRFGKYIEIQFDDTANIIGAKIKTYLLERSRLIFQPATERNYHIFYQLCAGAPTSERKEYGLDNYNAFHFLNQSGTGTVPGVDDAAEFELTQKALSTVGLPVQLQWKIFRLLAALLHIGNIQITGRGDAVLSESDTALLTATRLLGIESADFRKWIVRKQIVTRSEKIVTNLSPTQAYVVKDSVAKYIYANLFDWLVGVTNDSLSCPDSDKITTFIGVLDIYGFEHFKKNSFEQFCINYANEKLQQQFNQHVFKLEQEEYVREKINWTFIEFSDNQKCIELIEGKLGVLSLLDEESRLPAGTDQGFCQKLYTNFDNPNFKNYFKKPRFSNNAFTIAHYAHDVQYEAENFLDKNKDTVPDEHLSLLQGANFDFLKEVLEKAAANTQAPMPENSKRMSMIARKPTLGSIFKLSLVNLMDTIGNTNVHYIRCIKPNEAKVAWAFEPNMVLSQLRACGVLETIRISCAGYPSRWTFEEFVERYYALVSSTYWHASSEIDVRNLCSVILDESIKDRNKYQVGLTKIFFRSGQLAYLEKLRLDKYNACATLVQKNVRRFIYHARYTRMRDLAIRLQCVARCKVARSKIQSLRKERAAIIIQTYWRMFSARKQFLAKRQFILRFQTVVRGHIARRKLLAARETHAAIQIQRVVRGWIARKDYHSQRQLVIYMQSCIRRRIARKALMALKAEASSINHLKEVSYKLESKVVELTQSLTSLRDEKNVLAEKASRSEHQSRTWMEKHKKAEQKALELEAKLQVPTVPRSQWDAILVERDALRKDYQESLAKIKDQDSQISKLSEQLAAESESNRRLQKTVEEAKAQNSRAPDESELTELKSQIAALKTQLSQSLNGPRQQRSTSKVRALSPGNLRSASPSPVMPLETKDLKAPAAAMRSKSPTGSSINRKLRRNSSSDVSNNRVKSSIDNILKAESLLKTPRPISIDQYSTMLGSKITENAEEEIDKLLREEETLQEEVLEGMIKGLKMPLPSEHNPPSRKEILFPAHIISLCVKGMWQLGYIQESERLLFTVMDTIQKQCLSFTGEESIGPCAFWLTNVHELFSLICVTQRELEQEMRANSLSGRRPVGWQDFEKLLETVIYELQCLEDNIFHAWMKELKKRVSTMAIPAVIEDQSLPGFVVETPRILKFIPTYSQPLHSMDDLLNFLNKLRRTMTCYYVETSVSAHIFDELVELLGVITFNSFLMRKKFCSWKRGMQIQYNITRLEEWYKNYDIAEAMPQLEPLVHSAKLLQMRKETLEDIDNIFESCYVLLPVQIQKLLSLYHVAEYEPPISPEILKAVAARVASSGTSNTLLLDPVPLDNTKHEFEIPVLRDIMIQNYLPAWLDLKRLRRLTMLLQLQQEKSTMG